MRLTNHDEAISADGGSVQSRPPSVVAKLMGLEALPDSTTTNQKQETGVTPISPPFYAVTSKVNVSMRRVPFTLAKRESSRRCLSGYSDHPNYMSHTESSRAKLRSISAPGGRRRSKYSNVQPNDDQHREAVGELKKATYRGTQVSREVSLIEPVSGGGGDLPPGPLPISATTYDTSMIVYLRQLRAITPLVPLILTFITSSLLTCPSASLVDSSIGICRTPTVTGQMANSVTLVAFGST
ncbi:IQ-DOMAIN 14-like protein [Tanacetum coccineum]